HKDDSVGRRCQRRSDPDGSFFFTLQHEATNSLQDHLENRETAAESFFGKQVTFSGNAGLSRIAKSLNVCHHLQWRILAFQPLQLCLWLLSVFAVWPWKNVLEWGCLEKVTHFLLRL